MNFSALPTTPASAPVSPEELRHALLAAREQTLTQLYRRTFPAVRRHVLRQGGTADDAQDVFHDALVVFYEQVVAGSLVLTAAPSTYLVGVCRNLWRRELDRRRRGPVADLDLEQLDLADETLPAPDPVVGSVLSYVEQLGERCRSILLSFYYFQQPLTEIARAHDYRSVRSATVQKYKCLERLRGAVRHLRAELFHAHAS